jgi:tetratricopeptide (TPR) repeat protein
MVHKEIGIILICILIPFYSYAQDAKSLMDKGQADYKAGKYDTALPYFEQYVQLKSQEMPGYHWLGWTHYRLGRYNEAIEILNKANSILAAWDTYSGLGQCYYAQHDYEKALEYFAQARKLDPQQVSLYQWTGYTYYNLRQYQDALEYLVKANSMKEYYTNYNWLGRCYENMEDYETAHKYYQKFAELHPADVDAWLPYSRLGWNYFHLQMYYDAIEYLKESIKIKPVIDSYVGLCKVYQALGDYAKAREILNAVITRADSDDEKKQLKFLLGYNHVALGRYEEGYKVFGKMNTLGIEIRSVKDGMKIIGVFKNGPAELAGLMNGYVLQEFAGIPLAGKTTLDFVTHVIPRPAFGSKVRMKVYHDGYSEDMYMYVGLSPEIINLAQNDADLIRQRERVRELQAKAKLNIAVMELKANGVLPGESKVLTARVRSELFNTSKYNVLERDDMSTLLDEQVLQQTGLTSDENLTQTGKLLNVQYLVAGSISKVGSYYSISLRLIDIETGKIKSMVDDDIQGSIEDVLTGSMRKTVYKLIQ